MARPVSPTPSNSVYRDFVGVTVLAFGGLLAVSVVSGAWGAAGAAGEAGAVCATAQGGSYLAQVWARSLTSLYQLALMAGVFAVPLHLAWVLLRREAPASYIGFSNWAQTLFTSLGFLGTIVGVSLAVGGLDAAMQDGEPTGLICGLSTAFDTTFLGLVGAIALLVARRVVQSMTGDTTIGAAS